MNQCKPEKVDAKEHGKMLERILVIEERKGSCEKCERIENCRAKRQTHQERMQRTAGGI